MDIRVYFFRETSGINDALNFHRMIRMARTLINCKLKYTFFPSFLILLAADGLSNFMVTRTMKLESPETVCSGVLSEIHYYFKTVCV